MVDKIKVTFLGTNGWYTTETGNTVCTLIDSPKAYIVLDAGNGIYKLDQYIKDNQKPIYLFLSHLHLDHSEGLHILAKFAHFNQVINILCPKEDVVNLKKLMDQPYSVPPKLLKTKVKIAVVHLGQNMKFPFNLQVEELSHSVKCLGFRFEIDEKVITYCTDTGICAGMRKVAHDADLLIAECSIKTGDLNIFWPHLSPKDSAELAKELGVKKLMLTHFVANVFPEKKDRKEAEIQAREIFQNSFAAYDGMTIKI